MSDTLLSLLTDSLLPLKLPALVKQSGLKKKQVSAELETLVSQGLVHALALNPKKPTELSYTARTPLELTTQLLVTQAQALGKAAKPADLQKKLPAALRLHFDSALTLLIDAGQLHWLPKAVPLLQTTPPRPSDLLLPAQTRVLKLVLAQVNRLRAQPGTLEDLLAWLDDAAPALPAVEARSPARLTPNQLREWYAADRARSSTQMIPLLLTWRRYQSWAGGAADLQEMRSMMEALYNAGQVLLEPCERPQDLPDEERALLIPLALGPPGHAWCFMEG